VKRSKKPVEYKKKESSCDEEDEKRGWKRKRKKKKAQDKEEYQTQNHPLIHSNFFKLKFPKFF
jgi:hypothetical protein